MQFCINSFLDSLLSTTTKILMLKFWKLNGLIGAKIPPCKSNENKRPTNRTTNQPTVFVVCWPLNFVVFMYFLPFFHSWQHQPTTDWLSSFDLKLFRRFFFVFFLLFFFNLFALYLYNFYIYYCFVLLIFFLVCVLFCTVFVVVVVTYFYEGFWVSLTCRL